MDTLPQARRRSRATASQAESKLFGTLGQRLVRLRLYSWVRFEPTKGTPLAPLRGSRPGSFALPVLSVSLVPVHRLCLGRGDPIVPRKCALKGGHWTPNPLSF